jgi:microcystin-dependent protein
MPGTADLLTRGFAADDDELGIGLVSPPRYRVFFRNERYEIVDELDNWIHLDLVIRFNGIGTWHLEISNDELNVASIILQRAFGIVVRRDATTVFSGSVTQLTRTARTIRASGEDDMAHLRALALPNPLTSPPYTEEFNVVTAQASAVMLNLVNNNIGPAARVARRVPGLTLAGDPGIGSTITARARFQPLITLLSEIAITPLAGGLGFSVLQSDVAANTLEFRVWAPQDRSAEAKFSVELGTAQDYEDTLTAPPANAPFLLLGDGLGADRSVLENASLGSIAEWGRRWETLIDRRDVKNVGEGNQALAEAIAQAATSHKVTITPIDVPSLQYGTDWDLGDLVSFSSDRGTFIDLVREVEVTLDPERNAIIKPMIGQQNSTGDDPLMTHVAAVTRRVTNLERVWNLPEDSIQRPMLEPTQRTPIGKIEWMAGNSVPVGYLPAQGSAYSRTTYADLFAVIGTTYGAGNGTTTFNVPDLRDRLAIGSGSTYTIGQVITPTHDHPFEHRHDVNLDHNHDAFTSGSGSGNTGTHTHSVNPPALGEDIVQTESNTTNPDTTDSANTLAALALLPVIYTGVV